MIELLRKSAVGAFAVVSALFTFLPESFFAIKKWLISDLLAKNVKTIEINELNVFINRCLSFLLIWIMAAIAYGLFLKFKWFVTIKGKNYTIRVEYGDLLKAKKCRKVISFDECYTTQVGMNPGDIKPTSICGQYINEHPNLNIKQILTNENVLPECTKSKYQNKDRYKSGSMVQNGNDLLLAFAPLDVNGRARFSSRSEYISCLSTMWEELHKYYNQQDISISILGSGQTYIDGNSGTSLSQQELLDIIILSYKLSSHKIKYPYKLRIICKKSNGFSLNDIDSK